MALQLFHPSESSPVSSCILEDPLESLAASTSTPQVLQMDFLRATGVHRAVSEPVLQLVAHSGLPQVWGRLMRSEHAVGLNIPVCTLRHLIQH